MLKDTDSAPSTTTPRKDQSIRKYFQVREQNGDLTGQETPSRTRGSAMVVDGDGSPSRPANRDMRPGEQQRKPAYNPTTPLVPANASHPAAQSHRPLKRRREDDDDEYPLSDFSAGEEEQIEQILSAASRRTNMSPPSVPAETPTRRANQPSSTSTPGRKVSGASSALPTPSTRSSLGATRRRILDSNASVRREPTTPQHGQHQPTERQSPHTDTAASINADLFSIRALVSPRLDTAASARLEELLTRISMKTKSGASQRDMFREAIEKRGKEALALRARNTALENEVRGLRESMTKLRGGMLDLYKDT